MEKLRMTWPTDPEDVFDLLYESRTEFLRQLVVGHCKSCGPVSRESLAWFVKRQHAAVITPEELDSAIKALVAEGRIERYEDMEAWW